MNSATSNTSSIGGFFSLLALVFIALKLMHYITWSWWWVLAPLWIPWIVILLILGIVVLVAIIRNH